MKVANNVLQPTSLACAFGGLLLGGLAMTSGCDTKEKIVDIETPAGEVEVNEDTATGDVEVDVSDNE